MMSVPDATTEQVLDKIIAHAISLNASDLHFEPGETNYRIRLRIDGVLSDYTNFPTSFAVRVISRLKLITALNITERRLPQDGRLMLRAHPGYSIRVSTCPSLHGEKIVMRFIGQHTATYHLEQLGLYSAQLEIVMQLLAQPEGLILVAGPTGSGKSSTLYAALNFLNHVTKNIVTIEDPIEAEINGITQIQINPAIGLNFVTILRTVLRQDPDIIMIGEIRDHDTATLAIQAAYTGHLVLATIHANDSLSCITRLRHLGLSPDSYNVALRLILTQRLLRRRCQHCHPSLHPSTVHPEEEAKFPSRREEHPQDASRMEPFDQLRTDSCSHCTNGYKGRIGIFEAVAFNAMNFNLFHTQDGPTIKQYMQQHNILNLAEAGKRAVELGYSTNVELKRVLGTWNIQ